MPLPLGDAGMGRSEVVLGGLERVDEAHRERPVVVCLSELRLEPFDLRSRR